jgi:hypothetical protein
MIALALIKDAPDVLVVGVRQPTEQLFATLSATGVHFVLGLDDPRAAVAEIVADTGAELAPATRAVANCCPLMMRFASLPGALPILADRARRDPAGTIAAIAGHIGCDSGTAQIAGINRLIEAAGLGWSSAAHQASAEGSPAAVSPVVDGALSGYAAQFGGDGIDQLVWSRELFILFDDGSRRATGIIEVAGPPRPLIYGPYIHLPPGGWTARVTIGFSPETVGTTFVIDAFADPRLLAQAVITPSRGGIYSADLEFVLHEPSALGLEIRVMLASANARGRMVLGRAVLKPSGTRGPERVDSAEDFLRALEM